MKKNSLILLVFIGFSIYPAFVRAGGETLIPFNTQKFQQLNARAEFSLNTTGFLYQSALTQSSEKKSVGKAFFFSLLLPGGGQYYMGRNQAAGMFFAVEVFSLLGLLANNSYSDFLVKEYRTFAVNHAAIQRTGKDSQYWSDIGKYDDIYDYNEQRQKDRYFEALYEENLQNYWKWDEHQNRIDYDAKRLHANAVAQKNVYFQLAVVVNHLASAIHALYVARKHNKGLEQSWNLQIDTYGYNPSNRYVGINLTKFF